MFQRMLLHVLTLAYKEDKGCVENFVQTFLKLIDFNNNNNNTTTNNNSNSNKQGAANQASKVKCVANVNKYNIRYMAEYFAFLFEFARTGSGECLMLIRAGAIKKCASFYMFNRRPEVARGKNAMMKNGNKKGMSFLYAK